jgi:hypothetical protein
MLAAALRRPAAPQGQQLRRAKKAFEPVVIEVNIEAVADQARGNAVEDAPQDEAAARRDHWMFSAQTCSAQSAGPNWPRVAQENGIVPLRESA